MQQTEKYLNSILTKRIGSVINQAAFSKNAHTVTRLPRQEQTVDSMPTVFRKKYQTVLIQQRSRAKEMKISEQPEQMSTPLEQKPVESQRVQYMAISKRLSIKKNDDLISPTIDIGTYRVSQVNSNQVTSQKNQKEIDKIIEQPLQVIQPRMSQGFGSSKGKRRKIFG